MKKIITTIIFFICLYHVEAYAQVDSVALANADTTNFSINKAAGWNMYNSYVGADQDSVKLEVILLHNTPPSLQTEQYIGKIKKEDFFPSADRTFTVDLIVRSFLVRVSNNGSCYVRQITGPALVENPLVLPLQGYYKQGE